VVAGNAKHPSNRRKTFVMVMLHFRTVQNIESGIELSSIAAIQIPITMSGMARAALRFAIDGTTSKLSLLT